MIREALAGTAEDGVTLFLAFLSCVEHLEASPSLLVSDTKLNPFGPDQALYLVDLWLAGVAFRRIDGPCLSIPVMRRCRPWGGRLLTGGDHLG